MKTFLIEPMDVLFFRDAIPMSAGQGKGAGCRMPFPSTVHEAFRASLLRARGELGLRKEIAGRPRAAVRKGNWHAAGEESDVRIVTRSFRSLRTIGPLPWHRSHGLLLPVPLDAGLKPSGLELACLQLWRDFSCGLERAVEDAPACIPVAVAPPNKKGRLSGWWSVPQYLSYLAGDTRGGGERFRPIPAGELWEPEHRIGVEMEPSNSAAARGQLYAGTYLRPGPQTCFAVQAGLGDPREEANGESREIESLEWLLLGGEFRLARLHHGGLDGKSLPDIFAPLAMPPAPRDGEGPCLLKWVLATPAVFARGNLPGWCCDTYRERPGGPMPGGRVCFELPGQAWLVSWCIGKPRTVSGWDAAEGRAKPTLLAVPEGSVYYFLCEDRATAAALARKLHWRPRSDFFGEKGCGYGLVGFDARMHPKSPRDLSSLAGELFT